MDWWHATSTAFNEMVPDFAERFPNAMWLFSQQSDQPASDGDSSYVEQQAMANLRAGLSILLAGVR